MRSPQKKARRRRRYKKQDGTESLKDRVRKKFSVQQILEDGTQDGIKMSAVLEAFVAPYLDVAPTKEDFNKLLAIAIVAWNMSLLPESDRKKHIEKALNNFPKETRGDGREILKDLIERKEQFFSEYRRFIMDYELTEAGMGYDLTVVSTATELPELG